MSSLNNLQNQAEKQPPRHRYNTRFKAKQINWSLRVKRNNKNNPNYFFDMFKEFMNKKP